VEREGERERKREKERERAKRGREKEREREREREGEERANARMFAVVTNQTLFLVIACCVLHTVKTSKSNLEVKHDFVRLKSC
jgi:hypothetical protein